MKNLSGGHIVAVSSLTGVHPSQYVNAYAATKSGVNNYMNSLKEKLRLQKLDHKIKTTLVCPHYLLNAKDFAMPKSGR
jgi:short-subunit dehydrogenase